MHRLKWKIVKGLGLEALVWNAEWASGRWKSLEAVNPDSVDIVRQYAREGRIVELGCGNGALINQIGFSYFSRYSGWDISRSAIRRARSRNLQRCEFRVGRMQAAEFDISDLIVVQEALYYLEESEQHALIAKCMARLSSSGHFYVAVHDAAQFKPLLDSVRNAGSVVEDRLVKTDSNAFAHIVVSPSRP